MVTWLQEILSYAKLNMFLSCKTPLKHCSFLGGLLDATFLKFNWLQGSLMKHFMGLLFWVWKNPSNSIPLGRLIWKTINNFFKLLFFQAFAECLKLCESLAVNQHWNSCLNVLTKFCYSHRGSYWKNTQLLSHFQFECSLRLRGNESTTVS